MWMVEQKPSWKYGWRGRFLGKDPRLWMDTINPQDWKSLLDWQMEFKDGFDITKNEQQNNVQPAIHGKYHISKWGGNN